MKAFIAPKYNKKVCELSIVLEDMPDVITLWATGACNFRCTYCIQSQNEEVKKQEEFPINQMMSWDTFLKCMEQIKEFGKPLPGLVFCGIGEPLLNQKLPEMIAYIKKNKLAAHVELVTNAALLTKEKATALIEAGLDLMSVSIQGVNEDSYQKICGVKINLEKLCENLRFFAQNKKACHLHIKTVDAALNGREEYKRFLELFGDIADSVYVDHVFPLFKDVDYSVIISKVRDQYTGEELKMTENYPCALLFHALYVQPDGMIVPCCTSPVPAKWGSIYDTTLKKVWEGRERKELLLNHLQGKRRQYSACEDCVQPEILNSNEGIEKMKLEKLLIELEN